MNRKFTIVALLCALVCTMLSLGSCNFPDATQSVESTQIELVTSTQDTVVISVKEVTGAPTLYEVMLTLKGSGEFDFVSEDSAWGQSIVSINGVANPADWSSYWASYTTDEENGTDELTVDGVTWYYSAAGISSLKVKAGCSYMFKFEKRSY